MHGFCEPIADCRVCLSVLLWFPLCFVLLVVVVVVESQLTPLPKMRQQLGEQNVVMHCNDYDSKKRGATTQTG
jgi:hypothetical protein